MLKVFYNNIINRTVCFMLSAIFLCSFPSGAAASAICLDQEKSHIVEQKFYLDDCHSSVETYLPLSEEHCSALADKENNECVDVSLANADILNLPSKVILPAFSKNILSYVLPNRIIGFQQQVVEHGSSALSRFWDTSSHLNTHRTIVLLI